jgi:uncharacterized protein
VSLSLLIIQPTPFCNVDCDYCYLPDRTNRTMMAMETLRAIFANVFSSACLGSELTVVWHAGEPLVVPIAFYVEAIALARALAPEGLKITHSIQTNATLISPAWCAFFVGSGIRVGVSIDGPKGIHDAHRTTRGGTGTFEKAMEGVRQLRAACKEFHVISVLSEANIDRPDEMFDFYDRNSIDEICFNIEESDGVHVSRLLAAPNLRRRYHAFLDGFMHLVRTRRKRWFVREYDLMRKSIFRPADAAFGNTQTEPFSILTVAVNGDFSTFSPEFLGVRHPRIGDFVIGNLTEGPVERAVANPKFRSLKGEIDAGVEKCRASCEYFSVCGGGAPANKLGELGTMDGTATQYCECAVMGPADLVLSQVDEQILSASA